MPRGIPGSGPHAKVKLPTKVSRADMAKNFITEKKPMSPVERKLAEDNARLSGENSRLLKELEEARDSQLKLITVLAAMANHV
jgi:hypothetical protein